MASAVILTYERKPGFSRNTSMKKSHNASNGYVLDAVAPERSYTSETVADSSDTRRSRLPVATAPCVAQNFITKSVEPPSETASEDSCSLKRKSMSLNENNVKDTLVSGFGLSLRDLSRSEKRHLRKRIKVELQQVRSLSLRVEAREVQVRSFAQAPPVQSHTLASSRSGVNGSYSNGQYVPSAAESSFRDGRISRQPSLLIPEVNLETLRAAGKDKRTPKANQLYVNSEFLSGKDKLPPPEKQKSKAASNVKRSLHGKLDPRDVKRHKSDVSHHRRISELLKQCTIILKKLMGHKFGWVFNEPVDVVKLNLHDYLKVIRRPMDLGTIKQKLDNGVYLLPTEFCEDVRLTFANAMKYNPQGHDVYYMADTLRGIFEGKWKTLEEKLKELDSASEKLLDPDLKEPYLAPPEQGLPVSNAGHVPSSTNRPVHARKPKPSSLTRSISKSKSKAAAPPRRQMTFEEKQNLSDCLGSLPADKLEQAVQIMRKNPNLTQNDDEIEVDIESFDSETLWELHQFVMDCNRPKKQERSLQAGPQGANIPQMSNGASKTPKPTQRGIEAGEEEVDIGDDMPAKEFPPVVIEMDRGVSMKNSSSSSSSSGSGSSSSDSDSGSSSGSDSEADDGHSTGVISKVPSTDKV